MATKYLSDWRQVGDLFIHRYSIASTDAVVYEVYEAVAGHTTTMTGPGPEYRSLGTLPSRPVPAAIDAIPVGPDRWDRLDAWRAGMHAECWSAIVSVFPEAAKGHRDHFGRIEGTIADVEVAS